MSDLHIPINPGVTMPYTPGTERFVQLRNDLKVHASDKDIEKAAKDFESVLLHKLMDQMQRTVPESGLLDSGISKQIQGLFWFYMAQEVADQGGMGLWRDIYREMSDPAGTDPAGPAVEQHQ